MKCFALLLALTFSSLAASWDGVRGPFTVVSFWNPPSASLPIGGVTLPAVPANTMILIRCSDSSVAAVRVTVTLRTPEGERAVSYITEFYDGNGGVVTTIPQADIVSVKFTSLRDGETY